MDAYSILSYARTVGEPAVLATLVHVEGHSYRKAGASMLLLPNGEKIGSLSPGCLESDLQERVESLLHTGEAEWVVYNMRPEEDAIWGEAIGCGGVLRILLEPLNEKVFSMLSQAYFVVEAGMAVEFIRYSEEQKLSYAMRKIRDGYIQDDSVSLGVNKRKALLSTTFTPRPRLFLFGADEGTVPIVRIAGSIGFRVAVGDWRASLCNTDRFPDAELAVGTPNVILDTLRIQPSDYVLICGHQLQKDREMLEQVLPLKPHYIGVMGSKSRIRHLLEGLSDTQNIKAPVGMAIGAEGPQEIAISIAAELITVRNGRQRERGVIDIADRWNLYGGRSEQENGSSQAFLGACAR